ncbi:aminotransferase class I/II-fold pyridoxal phosphate-dependent enzyme [Mesorhizobium caraganae]|uniref:aminotransferase class I/II-fold pyridoxal phosphate-dependent enzyme n=1 Tax=Mesorhizobium caraganae TaxID=483206 RepID=UPI001FEDE8F6|nr:aminotransferase class I/II-fold pyridoxal phosphate-dependent enzyme [Mesorhizobium caraganae]
MSRPNKQELSTLTFNSLAVHGGNEVDKTSGAIRTPIVMANSYALPYDPSMKDWSDTQNPSYTRNSGHNQICLQRKLAAMEGGGDAAVFATGVAALHAVFFTFLKTGDHVIVSDVTYQAVWRLFAELLPQRYQIEVTFVDMGDMGAIKAAVRPNTKLIHTETIANPTTKVADIAALVSVAKKAGILLSVDSTFTPPPSYEASCVNGSGGEITSDAVGIGLAANCGTSPHHLISGRLGWSLHPYPACTGKFGEAGKDGTHLFDGVNCPGGRRSTSIPLRRK